MKNQRPRFPLIVGLATDRPISSSPAGPGVRELLHRLHQRSPAGLLIVSQICDDGLVAGEAGFRWETLSTTAPVDAPEADRKDLASAQIELVECSDLILVITNGHDDEMAKQLTTFALHLDRPVVRIDTQGAVLDEVPIQLESEAEWLPDLFARAGLSPNDSLETIQAGMDQLASHAAPITRRWWKWILFLQGITVLVPLVWLMQRLVFVRIEWAALLTFFSVLLLVAVSWWLRWRGMQKTWARARLVAELARSFLATSACPPGSERRRILAEIPALRSLFWLARRTSEPLAFPQWRDRYLETRVDDQERYFREKQRQAESQRKNLTRWATLLLDIALAFAFAGTVISLAPDARTWLRMLGDVRLEIVLGVAGVAMPLGLLLIQLLRGVQEVNRRTARFAQQRQILQQARIRLTGLSSPGAAMEVVEGTEHQLLAEVMEWYFHAETAEHFFPLHRSHSRPRPPKSLAGRKRALAAPRPWAGLGKAGWAGLFLARVILGRLPWVVGSGAAALIWIFYFQPVDLKSRNELKILAQLKGSDGETWNPTERKAENGCVVIVHGLWGHSAFTAANGNWMQQCASAIESREGEDRAPNICLIDWQGVATPSKIYTLTGSQTARMLQDVAAIRNQAYEVGEEVAFRLGQLALANKKIRRDRPMHLIGHSAGGFVVTRAAIVLSQLHLAPSPLRVTILDTPAPDKEMLFDLPRQCPVDFYITSPVGGRTPQLLLGNFSSGRIHMEQLVAPAEKGWLDKHRWAYDWFKDTIINPKKWEGEGFNRSPLEHRVPSSNPQ